MTTTKTLRGDMAKPRLVSLSSLLSRRQLAVLFYVYHEDRTLADIATLIQVSSDRRVAEIHSAAMAIYRQHPDAVNDISDYFREERGN